MGKQRYEKSRNYPVLQERPINFKTLTGQTSSEWKAALYFVFLNSIC